MTHADTDHDSNRAAPGEDAALGRVTDEFVALLGRRSLTEFALTPFDRVGVPVWQSWWNEGARSTGGMGYGPTEQRARVGALGECVEHACAVRSLPARPHESGSTAELTTRFGVDAVVDPRLLGLPAGADYDDDRPLLWWPLRRWPDGQQVWAPVEFVASSPAELPGDVPPGGWLITPVSNGLGAGMSIEQAVAHATLEILQRDGNGLSFRALDAGRVVDLEAVSTTATLTVLDTLRAAGVEVMVKIGATDFGLPNLYVVGMAPDDDVVVATACGEAVHPDREVALSKAVFEFASARARKAFMHGPLDRVLEVAPEGYESVIAAIDPSNDEQRVLEATLDWLRMTGPEWQDRVHQTVLRHESTTPFASLPTTPVADHASLLRDVAGRLAGDGLDVLVHDLSGDAGGAAPVPSAVKVIVPGLEVETVAYGRIGERNVRRLLAAGRNDLVRVGEAPDGWQRVHLTDAGRQRLGGDAWLDREALDGVAAGLLPLYREPGRHSAQLALRG